MKNKVRIDFSEANCWWLDIDTFIVSVFGNEKLKEMFPTLIDTEDILEEDIVHLDCEYWKDEDSYHYILIYEDDSIEVSEHIDTLYMNPIVFSLSQKDDI